MKQFAINKKILTVALAAAIAAALTATAIGLGVHHAQKNTAAGWVTLDVNPGVKLETTRDNKVLSVSALNEDAEKLLEGYQIGDDDLEETIEDIVNRMILSGYLSQGGSSNGILISTSGDDIYDDVDDCLESMLNSRGLDADVLFQTLDDDEVLEKEAEKYGISTGKMQMIRQLLANGAALSASEMAEMRISDLLTYARTNAIPLSMLDDDRQPQATITSSSPLSSASSVPHSDNDWDDQNENHSQDDRYKGDKKQGSVQQTPSSTPNDNNSRNGQDNWDDDRDDRDDDNDHDDRDDRDDDNDHDDRGDWDDGHDDRDGNGDHDDQDDGDDHDDQDDNDGDN